MLAVFTMWNVSNTHLAAITSLRPTTRNSPAHTIRQEYNKASKAYYDSLPRTISLQHDAANPREQLVSDTIRNAISPYATVTTPALSEDAIVKFWFRYNKTPAAVEDRPKKFVHFVFLGEPGDPGIKFTLLDYLVIRAVFIRGQPDAIYLQVNMEPLDTPLWCLIQPMITSLVFERSFTHVFGNPISGRAHLSDVYRLQGLMRRGGVYLDIDALQVGPLDTLMAAPSGSVMGWEIESDKIFGAGVITARPGSKWLQHWFHSYTTFDDNKWADHCGPMATKMAFRHSGSVDPVEEEAFYRPYVTHEDMLWEVQLDATRMYDFSQTISAHYWGTRARGNGWAQRLTPYTIVHENTGLNQLLRPLLPNPMFTVIVPCTENSLAIIDSVMNQSFPLWEVLVTGDCMDKIEHIDGRVREQDEQAALASSGAWTIEPRGPLHVDVMKTMLNDMLQDPHAKQFVYAQELSVNFTFNPELVAWSRFGKGEYSLMSAEEPQIPFTADCINDPGSELCPNQR